MHLNTREAVTLPAWPSSKASDKRRGRYSGYGPGKVTGHVVRRDTILLLGHSLLRIRSLAVVSCRGLLRGCCDVWVGGCKYGQSRPLCHKPISNGWRNALRGVAALVWALPPRAQPGSRELSCSSKLPLQNLAAGAEAAGSELNRVFISCMCKNKTAVAALASCVFVYICPRTERGFGTAPKATGVWRI